MKHRRMFTIRRMATIVLPLLVVSFLRIGGEPSWAEKAQTMLLDLWAGSSVQTKTSQPRFRSKDRQAGDARAQVEQRMRDFLARHPSLQPEWRDVPPQENGYLLLKKFVEGEPPPDFSMDESIKKMMSGEAEWDAKVVSEFLQERSELLAQLRLIGRMTDRSTKGVPWRELDFIGVLLYVQSAELLALSLSHHLRIHDVDAALVDFSTARGIASHLDQHEVPTLLAKTAGMIMRVSVNRQLMREVDRLPADMDFTPWIRLLADEPPFGPEMARVYRGEALASISLAIRLDEFEIGDLTSFEDAIAHQTLTVSDFLEREGRMPDQEMWAAQEANWQALGPDAYMLLTTTLNGKWLENTMWAHTKSAMELAALEILDAERVGGAITDADDSRLAGMTKDPSTGKPFVFDPSTRELSGSVDSALFKKEEKHVVRLPKR